jgi:hypothetical protein
MLKTTRFQPGWATPIEIDHGNPSFLARFLRIGRETLRCKARKQGKCPGLDQCHDCAWSSQGSRR